MIKELNMTTQTVRSMTPVQLEEKFRCCICLDIYTDPVSIPCGHNFCQDCIEDYWDTKEKADCPLCKEIFSLRPPVRRNHEFADIIKLLKRSLLPTTNQEGNVGHVVLPPTTRKYSIYPGSHTEEVPCDICNGQKSLSVKSCLVCQASYCEIHLSAHQRDAELQRHRLTDPATFPTSHLCRNHNKPLTMFCKSDRTPVCVKCTERDHKHHKIVPMEKESNRIKTNVRATKAEIQKMIQARLRKMEEINKSLVLSEKITEREIERSAQVCTLLIKAVERHQAELVEELNLAQEESMKSAQGLLEELKQEINGLQKRNSELHHLESTLNPLHVLQSFPSLSRLPSTKEWSKVSIHSDNCVGVVRKAISKFMDKCQDVENKLWAEEADKMNQYAVDITLDPDTASGWLLLSTDGKKVSCQKKITPRPQNPQRFDSCVCVLAKQSFTSGRCYWEVEVGDKTDWDLGVARQSINRKGSIMVRPASGYWAICRRKGGNLSACAGPSATIRLQETPKKVGIFLDCEKGSVSFYDAQAKTHIYTYSSCTFTEPLYPYFNPCVQENGKNMAPLVICPVLREEQDIVIE